MVWPLGLSGSARRGSSTVPVRPLIVWSFDAKKMLKSSEHDSSTQRHKKRSKLRDSERRGHMALQSCRLSAAPLYTLTSDIKPIN